MAATIGGSAGNAGGFRGETEYKHPPGFRLRRVQNWILLGFTYASYYLCRYNLGAIHRNFTRIDTLTKHTARLCQTKSA